MIHIEKKGRLKNLAVAVFLSLFALGLLADPKGSALAAKNGVVLSVETVIPSLFPFFVLSGIVMNLNTNKGFGILAKHTVCRLFHINSDLGCGYLLGIVGGYPIGARNVCAVYRRGRCTKKEAERALSFSNNCGPAFILSVAGIYLFDSIKIGLMLYIIHILSSAFIAILLRPKNPMKQTDAVHTNKQMPFTQVFVKSVKESTVSIANVCSFVVIFAVLIYILEFLGFFSLIPFKSQLFTATIKGLFEVTGGIRALQSAPPNSLTMTACSFLLGFGGICVHCQTASAVSDTDLSMKPYFLAKIAQGIFAALLTVLLSPLFFADTLSFATTTYQIPPYFLICVAIFSGIGIFFRYKCKNTKKSL